MDPGLYGPSQGVGFHPVIKVCCLFVCFLISSFKQGSGLHVRTITRKITLTIVWRVDWRGWVKLEAGR